MEYLVNASQMKQYDKTTTEEYGISSLVLMERAALACADVILSRERTMAAQGIVPAGAGNGRKVLVAAGCGNNGGDGIAIGRLLRQNGFSVTYALIGNREKCTPETKQQLETEERYGSFFLSKVPEDEYDIIIDALFGIGLTRKLEGIFADAVREINRKSSYVLSVDIPSGIHADTGAVMGCAVAADVTVTFAFRKAGCIFYPGCTYAGQLICRDIGITEESFKGAIPSLFTFRESPEMLMPPRAADGNKGTFGKVALAAGSSGMCGAALLSGRAVLGSGAGMLRIITAEENRYELLSLLPEAMVSSASQADSAAAWADVLAAGPGMGTDLSALCLLRSFLFTDAKPLVLDADALNILSENSDLFEMLQQRQQNPDTRRPLVLTPHPGELARLTGGTVAQITSDPVNIVLEWARRLHASVLCKGARTVIGAPDGRCYVNTSGNSGMATAGSGDVLTGIIAALLAQGMDAFEAACLGVYLHGLAGDKAAHEKGEYSMLAGDITAQIGNLLR